MKVFIYGFNGNMGRRYRAILDHLGHECGGYDFEGGGKRLFYFAPPQADCFLVASPTKTHCEILFDLKDCGRPILCEKPITKSMTQLEDLIAALKRAGTRLQMVSQYDYLGIPETAGETLYDYYRHGSDGLLWDCINIIWHAKGEIILGEKSPVWHCQINGKWLNLGDMDRAYVTMLEWWLKDPTEVHYDRILEAHQKVHKLEATWRTS